ncbi:D-2-hydroxyacid dehydrogenase [Crassaminicella profunda]|uniref:D-2-hydroxyacid dehydrogenase n=1 Tax=Crassaminicella profunda TaxID=1286698 RepID=UPI001CA630C6|nr:D-2-hydroxyacid dehydrogenase [Crassaminicella profunda]QZY54493.1 D-2-hydroxyacid dehydrogenase [Crassaminicella profunda]
MKIVVLDGYTLNPGDLTWEGLEKLGEVMVYNRTPEEKIIERVGDAQIIYINKTVLKRETLEKLSHVKFIGVLATGYNVVDVDAAKELGIVVTNIPTYGTQAVAQFTFALLLEICHHVGEHDLSVKRGVWSKSIDFCYWKYPLMELAGKTMGIIGLGRIGQEVAKIAQAFGMNVLAYANHPKRELENEMLKYVELDTLFEKSDIISLHCPLFENTRGIINKENIAKMKDGVMIINTSRGPLIIEEDLAEALNSGKVASAAVDVLSEEPAAMDNPLMIAKNCIITPHIAWAPREARERLMNIAVDNLKQFLKGTPVNVVNL